MAAWAEAAVDVAVSGAVAATDADALPSVPLSGPCMPLFKTLGSLPSNMGVEVRAFSQ